jgi:hypothetical protein
LQTRVFVSFTVNFSFVMMSRILASASSARASCQLIHTAITAGTSRVAYGPLCLHAVANTPAGLMELVRSYRPINFGLPSI